MSAVADKDVVTPRPETSVPAKPKAHRSSQGLYSVWHGMTFSKWLMLLSQRPPLSWRKAPRIASITLQSLYNSVLTRIENLRFGRAIEKTTLVEPPIFILGHWRSGTTLLHNLMSLDPRLTSPNMYQVLFPSHYLTTEALTTRLTSWLVPSTRPMDEMPASWDMPQEDELALLILTGLSPYLMLAFQNQRPKYERFFEVADMSPAEQQMWKKTMLQIVKKLTYKTGKIVCLKSPSHTFRVEPLLELFPQAKFIYIRRNPYDVYNSSLHLRRSIYTENGLCELNQQGLEEDMRLTYQECIETYERTKSLIPPGHLHEVQFEELEADPLQEMRRIYERLQLAGWQPVEAAIQARLPQLKRHRKNEFPMSEAERRRIYESCRSIFERYGYASGLPEGA